MIDISAKIIRRLSGGKKKHIPEYEIDLEFYYFKNSLVARKLSFIKFDRLFNGSTQIINMNCRLSDSASGTEWIFRIHIRIVLESV